MSKSFWGFVIFVFVGLLWAMTPVNALAQDTATPTRTSTPTKTPTPTKTSTSTPTPTSTLTSMMTSTPYPGVLTTSLISCWDLNELDGTRYDYYGANDLTDINTVGNVSGVVDYAAYFIWGNYEKLEVSSNSGLTTGDIDFTIALWVNLDSKSDATEYAIIGKRNATEKEYWLRYLQSSDRFNLRFSWDGGGTNSTSVYADNMGAPALYTWYWVMFYNDSVNDVMGISVNNGSPNTASFPHAVYSGNAPVDIGGYTSTTYYPGAVDGVMMWKRLLTSSELGYVYNDGNGRSCEEISNPYNYPTPTPAAYYYFTTSNGSSVRINREISYGDITTFVALGVFVIFFAIVSTIALVQKWLN